MRYQARFYGRTRGAIGIFYWIAVEVEAETPEAARLKLYDTHEHLHQLTLTPITEPQSCPASVIRYVPTYINKDGMRTLMLAQQGRHTFETAREAERWIDAMRAHTSADTLRQVYGEDTFEVCACPCYPGHFDPQTCWFDDADIVTEATR